MNIAAIRFHVARKALDGRQRNPRFAWTHKQVLLVQVVAEDGTTGVGEAWSDAGSAESITAFLQHDLAPRLIGRDIDHGEAFWAEALDWATVSARRSQSAAAMSAVDIALWDLRGKRMGLPVWRLLGGHGRPARPYASGGLYATGQSPDDLGREFAAYVERGFRAVKIKVGGAPLATDLERVAAVRRHVGPDVKLMVDAVSNYDVPRAIAFARAAAVHDPYWFEQPVPIEDVAGEAKVHRDGGIPVAGNENEFGVHAFRRLLEADAVHFVQFDLIISGGFTYGRRLAALAEAFGKPVTLHHSNSIVSMLANLHFAASWARCDSVEYHVIHQPFFERADPALLTLCEGAIAPPERPGLGVDLDDLFAD